MSVPRVPLGDDGYTIAQVLVGGWQLSPGHRAGAVDERRLFGDLERLVEAGLTTFDCADIYTGVEDLFGRFAARSGVELQLHTKFVPDEGELASLRRADVERAIDRSLRRLRTERLDLVQFSWWDYGVPGYVDAALWLAELQDRGKIRHLGLTNFDVPRTREILDAGVPLVCNQVQYSLLDRRPERGMVGLAVERRLGLLAYGTLAGGLLSDRYLGLPESEVAPETRSLVKYRLIQEEFGDWSAHQALLRALSDVGRRNGVPLAAVALRWVLDRPGVAGAIVGTYHAGHLDSILAALELRLGDAGERALAGVLRGRPGPRGDVFGLEREREGAHGRLLWRNLNRGESRPAGGPDPRA